MELAMKQKGIITLIGGFMLELVTGTVFLWGQFNVYITSYFRQKDDSGLELSVGGAIFPVMTASLALGIPMGIKGIKFFGSARLCCIFCSFFASLSVFVVSYTQKFWQFVLIYGVLHGIAQGAVYFIPIYMGYLFFPTNKRMVSGIVTCGFALISFAFGLIFFAIMNPDGLAQIQDSDGFSLFPRTFSLTFFSSLLILYHPNQIGEEEKRLKLELKNKQEEKKILEQNVSRLQKRDEQLIPNSEQINTEKLENKQNEQSSLRKSIQLFNKTIGIVNLESQFIQKKIELTQKQEKQQSYRILLPHQNIQNDKEFQKYNYLFQNRIYSNQNEKKNYNENQQSVNYENNSLLRVVSKDIKIMDLNKRIASIIQNDDRVQDKPQHTNELVQDSSIDHISKINEDINYKENQVQEELQSFFSLEMEIERLNKLGAPSILVAFKQPQLYVSFLLGISAIGFGVLINGNYKSIAKDYGFTNDNYQTLVGSLGGIANGFSRPLWASLLDKFTFKHVLNVILGIQIVCIFTMRLISSNQIFFIIWVFITHMTMGAVLGMWPVLSAQLNGVKVGSQLFGLYWFGFSMATMIQFLIILGLKKSIRFDNIYYIYAIQAILSVLIIQFYPFKVNWSKYYLIKQKMLELPTQNNHNQQKEIQQKS
ncbi:hypothetical protein ABPG72_020473 [Tetrahymena utriculariae]